MTEKDDLRAKVTKWLSEQGYPLEMRVASLLQKVGFRIVQSEYFSDPDTGDSRELDVVAYKQKEVHNVLFRISLLIECKRSTDKPWLLFTSDKTHLAGPARVVQRAANSLGKRILHEVCRISDVQNLPIFSLPQRPAYGVTQALTTGKDVCYSAVTSVSKASLATVAELDKKEKADKKSPRLRILERNICSIVFPVVIVEGNMLEVFLDDTSNVNVGEIKNGTLLWRNPVVGMPHTIVNIVSFLSFEDFSIAAHSSIDKLFDLLENQLSDNIKEAIRANRSPI